METLFVGRNTIFLPEINSTNSYAIHMLKNVNPPEGTIVHTAHQTHGRGQRGNGWEASPGSNVTASIILKPGFLPTQKHFFLYQIMALAVYDTLAEMLDRSQFDIKIKWPNDILVNEKKAAGILIENNLLNSHLVWSVAGVGINVNQPGFEPGIQATSLSLLTGRLFDVKGVLDALCAATEKYYLALKNSRYEWIQQSYLDRLFGLDTWRDFETAKGIKRLLVCGVSEAGLLLLQNEEGRHLEADVKEVKWLY
jgi:BirA family biotin operon repressor/biotin-[acetyl-CoA-carboxylase] ligase